MLEFCVSGLIQRVPSGVWLPLLGMTFLRFTHTVPCICSLLLVGALHAYTAVGLVILSKDVCVVPSLGFYKQNC